MRGHRTTPLAGGRASYHKPHVSSPSRAARREKHAPVAPYVVDLLRSHKRLLLRCAATSAGRTVLVMAGILLIREFLAAVLDEKGGLAGSFATSFGPETAIWLVGVLLIVAYVGASLLSYDNQVVRQRIVMVVELALMERLVRQLLALSVGFFDRASHGDLVHAVREDVANLRAITMSCAETLMEGAVALGLVATAVWMSPQLAFWSLLVLPAASMPMVLIARRIRARSFAERRAAYAVFDVILQMLRGIRIIKVYQGEEQEARTITEQARRFFRQQVRIVQTRELSNVLLESLAGLSVAVVIIIGGFQVMHGVIQWPQLLAFLVAVRSLHGPLDHINGDLMEIQRHGAAVERIGELLALQPEVREAPHPVACPSPPRRIAFDDVTFSYGEQPAIDRLSFEVRAGETLGIAGASGSGKTTLLGLVARFHDPSSGVIRLDGWDLRQFRLHDVYRQLGIVTQEPFLFTTSVRENIRCGRPDAGDAEVEAAARAAEMHDEILALPRGYDTVIGMGGRSLSGGQAQRINVARAVLKNAPILLLDEATSSLDSLTETKVQRAIDRLMQGRTTLVVAHRLSSLRHANRILVLDRGRCVGIGSHEALLGDCQLYRSMWEAQLLDQPALDRVSGADEACVATNVRRADVA
jgi:ABC-type multidrug transport system fused ATPase/permease subunit